MKNMKFFLHFTETLCHNGD